MQPSLPHVRSSCRGSGGSEVAPHSDARRTSCAAAACEAADRVTLLHDAAASRDDDSPDDEGDAAGYPVDQMGAVGEDDV